MTEFLYFVTKITNTLFKAHVERIHVEGLGRTKDDIIQDAVRDLFTATDFQDVLVKAHRVSEREQFCSVNVEVLFLQVRVKLDSLGCFRNIAIFIDTAKGPKATADGLEVKSTALFFFSAN